MLAFIDFDTKKTKAPSFIWRRGLMVKGGAKDLPLFRGFCGGRHTRPTAGRANPESSANHGLAGGDVIPDAEIGIEGALEEEAVEEGTKDASDGVRVEVGIYLALGLTCAD